MKDQQHHSGRIKELSKELEQQFTHIEQQPPNQPNFLMVVLLFAAALIVIFIVAIFVLHLDRGRLFGHHRQHPTSQLILPAATPSADTAVQFG